MSLATRIEPRWIVTDAAAYAYLLGVYLGDGYIVRASPRSAWMAITLDARFPGIVAETAAAVHAVFPTIHATVRPRRNPSAVIVQCSHRDLPFAFPQHGPGRKHERPIVLAGWQQTITGRHPRQLIRGLIHSDGCRTVNRFSTVLPSGRAAEYEYPRYFFSNLSGDIRAIFCRHCDLLGIRWTQSNPRNISVAHRDSVALLDSFVGPKQ